MIFILKKFNKQIYCPYNLYPDENFILVTEDMVFDVYDYYMVSNYGRIFHRYLNRFLKPGINGGGYYFIMMSTKNGQKAIQIHRIVLIAFRPIQNYQDFQVNHINGNKLYNYLGNLEWCTRSENIHHAYNTGLHHRGQDNVKTNLTDSIVISICEKLAENKYTNKQIANIIGNGVTENIVSSIKQRQSWTHISNSYNFYQRPGRLFTEEMIRNLCIYFENNFINNLTVNDHVRNALNFYGYSIEDRYVDTGRKIYNKKYYTNISCNYNF